MGFVVDIRSSSFLLLARKMPKALKALKDLARERPHELEDPAATLDARDLRAALEANFWRATFDADGNAVALELGADKLPRQASDLAPAPFLDALSKHVEHGRVVLVTEANPAQATVYTLGKKLTSRQIDRDRYRFLEDDPRPRAAPGERIEKTLTLVQQWGDPVDVSPRVRNPETDVVGRLEEARLRAGETRTITLEIGPDALGLAWTIVDLHDAADGTTEVGCQTIAVEVEPRVHAPLEVASVERAYQRTRKFLLSAKEVPRALVDVKAHAAAARNDPGGAFLAAVEAAPDLVAALRAAGLEVERDGDVILSLRPRRGALPCSEHHLYRLFRSFAARTLPSSGGGFSMVKAESAGRRIEYSFSAGMSRRVDPIR